MYYRFYWITLELANTHCCNKLFLSTTLKQQLLTVFTVSLSARGLMDLEDPFTWWLTPLADDLCWLSVEGQVLSTGNFCLMVPTTQHDGWLLLREQSERPGRSHLSCLLLPCPGNYTQHCHWLPRVTHQKSQCVRMGHPSTWIEEGRIIGGHHGGWLPNYSKFADIFKYKDA